MRKLIWKSLLFVMLVLPIGMPQTAGAVLVNVVGQMTIVTDTWTPWAADLNGGAPFTIDVGPDGSFSLPASIYNATGSVGYPINIGAAATATVQAHNVAGSFAPGNNPVVTCPGGGNSGACVPGGGFGGQMRISGSAIIHTVGGSAASTFPLSMLGEPNTTPYTAMGGFGWLWGNAWTTQRASVTTGVNPAAATGQFWDDGTNAGSDILLVSVAYYRAHLIDTHVTGSLKLEIVPEPGTALLLGAGIAGLGALRWGRKPS